MGSKIREVLGMKGMTVSEFARRINTSRENVYGIFRRQTLDTGLLLRIRNVLEHDFFSYYNKGSQQFSFEDPAFYGKPSSRSTLLRQGKSLRTDLEACRAELDMVKKEVDYLRKINKLLGQK